MAISIKITSVERPDMEQARVTVRFAEGAMTLDRQYVVYASDDLTLAQFQAMVRGDRDKLAALTAKKNFLDGYVNVELG